jgi:hypothetical protein
VIHRLPLEVGEKPSADFALAAASLNTGFW